MRRIEHLVVLRYCRNTCYAEVTTLADALGIYGLQIDLENDRWSFDTPSSTNTKERSTRQIGQAFITHNVGLRREGCPIGVYDRTDIAQLSAMVSATINATPSAATIYS